MKSYNQITILLIFFNNFLHQIGQKRILMAAPSYGLESHKTFYWGIGTAPCQLYYWSEKNYEAYYRSARLQAVTGFEPLWTILSILNHFLYLGVSLSILVYLNLSCYNELSRLFLAISGQLWLSQAISGYFYKVSSIRMPVEEGESKILLSETCRFDFCNQKIINFF